MQASIGRNASGFPSAVVMRGAGAMRSAETTATSTHGITRTLAKGEELFAEGDDADYFYRVVSGTIRTCKLLSDGRRQIDAFHLAGDIFGMETGEEHRFSAEALGPTKVIAYRRCALETLAQSDPALGNQVVTSMMRSLERAQEHMLLLGRKTAMERVATFLLEMDRRLAKAGIVALPMCRRDIGDYLGLTLETVSRSLSELQSKGVLGLSGARQIVLRDRQRLADLNC